MDISLFYPNYVRTVFAILEMRNKPLAFHWDFCVCCLNSFVLQ